MKNLIRYLLLLLSLQLSVNNLYADNDASQLIRHQASGISYLNGGIGDQQRDAMKAARKDFNLQLTFAEKPSGRYIADVDIDIQTMSGKEILQLPKMGPIFMAQLPAGKYRIKATSDDHSQTKTIHVNKRGIRDLHFYWYH